MEGDDEVIVVVVGDEEDENKSEDENITSMNGVSIKVEALDDENSLTEMGVEELLETVEKHGEVVDVDLGRIVKPEPLEQLEDEEVEYIDDSLWAENDEDNFEGSPIPLIPRKRNKKYGDGKETFRHTMLKPHERRSFVKELKKQHPELSKNEKLLIDTLANIMRETKQPDLPKDHSFFNENAEMQCSKCTHVSETLAAAGRHYQERHGERYLICLACGVDFRSKTNLYKHEKRCPSSDAVVVLKARAQYVGRKGRSRPFIPHYERPFKKKSYYKRGHLECDLCPATFSSRVSLQAHLYLHDGIRPFRCPQCPAAYTSPTALSRHMAKHTSVEYICDHCKRSFKVKSALVVHMNTHKPEKRFGCLECPKRYAQKSALRLHVRRVHRNLPPPCACQICPRRYPRMSLLKAHMLKEHGMNILTRKMFLRYLPTMPDEEVVEQAKLIFTEPEPYDTEDYIPEVPNYDLSEDQAEEKYMIQDENHAKREPEYKLEISQLPLEKEFKVPENSILTIEQEELLQLLASAQQNGAQDVKLFSVKNGKMVQIELSANEREVGFEEV